MNTTNPLPITADQATIAICTHTPTVVSSGRLITIRCEHCRYELNVLTDHLRHETPRLALSDDDHQRLGRAFDAVHNSIVEIAQTLRVLTSGEANLGNMQAEIIDRIGKLGQMQDGLETFKAILDVPDPPSPTSISTEGSADPDWLSPDAPFQRPTGAITQKIAAVEEIADEDTQERQTVRVNPAASRGYLRLEESGEVQ